MKFRRPEPHAYRLQDGRVITLWPPLRAQMRAALALDPEPGETETAAQADARRAEQVRILTDGSGLPVNELTALEELEILKAILTVHHGDDPAAAAALQRALKHKSARRSRAERLAAFDADTLTLCRFLRCGMKTAEAEGFVDSLLLLESLYTVEKREATFQAALHDKKLV